MDGGREGEHMESELPLGSQTRAATFSGHFGPRCTCVFFPSSCLKLRDGYVDRKSSGWNFACEANF